MSILLDFYPGFHCTHTQQTPSHFPIHLTAQSPKAICSRCGTTCSKIHDRRCRLIRDCPFLGLHTVLHLTVRRLKCPCCQEITSERISWLASSYSRMTARLRAQILKDLPESTIKETAKRYALDPSTIKTIDKRDLQQKFGGFRLGKARLLAVVERGTTMPRWFLICRANESFG